MSITNCLRRGMLSSGNEKSGARPRNAPAQCATTRARNHGSASHVGLGGGGRSATSPPPAATPPPAGPEGPLGGAGGLGQKGFTGPGAVPIGAGGRGFNLSINYTKTRTRPQADTGFVGASAGSQQLGLRLSSHPPAHWSATWDSNYNFDTRQFGAHAIRLERDLHRWHASFSFLK